MTPLRLPAARRYRAAWTAWLAGCGVALAQAAGPELPAATLPPAAASAAPGPAPSTAKAGAPAAPASPGGWQGSTAPGAATRAWLDLQRSGAAAGSSHPMPGEIATHVWRRYADSFRQPIPDSFSSTLPRRGTER